MDVGDAQQEGNISTEVVNQEFVNESLFYQNCSTYVVCRVIYLSDTLSVNTTKIHCSLYPFMLLILLAKIQRVERNSKEDITNIKERIMMLTQDLKLELFVERKYGSFKDEMMNYKHEFKDVINVHMVIEKAHKYLQQSAIMKAMKAKRSFFPGDNQKGIIPPYYEIEPGSPLKAEHLMSVLLYTDYTKHCTSFSKSFRKNDSFEGLDSVKRRNSEYYWMSRRLRETVEIYGNMSRDKKLSVLLSGVSL